MVERADPPPAAARPGRRRCHAQRTPALAGHLTRWRADQPGAGNVGRSAAAEWFREHGGASVVVWAENEWYSHHQPKVGGALAPGTIHAPKVVHATPVAATVPHLPAPAPITPIATPPVAGEGQWSPAGRLVDGLPAVYETMLRPSADPHELRRRRRLDGHETPQGDPVLGESDSRRRPLHPHGPDLAHRRDHGGLRVQRRLPHVRRQRRVLHGQQDRNPLRTGAASFVVYKNGSATVAQWGRDATIGPNVVSVRQNLDLLVDNGQVVPADYSSDPTQWGATLGGGLYVWRSGSA